MKVLSDKEYLSITVPFMLSTMTQPLMGAVNTAVMGQMPDAKYIAAVSLGVILFNTIYWLFGFLRVSTTGYAAQAYGKMDKHEGMLAFFKPCIIALVVGFLCILLQKPLLEAYLWLIKPAEDVAELCKEYYYLLIWGAPLVLFNYVGLGWLMGQTRIKASVGMQMSMNILNCILSIWLVTYLDMGIAGVAWATLLCHIYGAVAAAVLMHIYGEFDYRTLPWGQLLDWRQFIDMLKVNANLMIRTVCLMGTNNVVAAVGASFGTEVLAANAVLLQIKDIISYLIDGMANGAAIFSGKACGKRDKELFHAGIAVTYKWLVVFSLALMGIYWLGHSYFIRIFTELDSVIALAERYNWYIILFPPVSGIGMVLYGVFSGATQTGPIRNVMVAAGLFFYITQWLLVPLLGNDGLWLAWLSFFGVQSVLYPLYLSKLKRLAGMV